VVQIQVVNSFAVGAFCPTNRHTVRLRFSNEILTLDFGEVFLGASFTRSVEVQNSGTADLNVTSIVSDNPSFVPGVSSLVLPPGNSQLLNISFAPAATGAQSGVLTLLSDDPDEGALTINLAGQGAVPPDIAVSPGSLTEISILPSRLPAS
jgi:hypothetical protein